MNKNLYRKTNFKEELEKFSIEIPIIQRDYAQGRNDEDTKHKIDNFLDSIYTSLYGDTPINLDFIYGNIEETKFIPFDGQQRLTLIFLLYLYFIKKENKENILLKDKESKFTYETRASSREFCRALVKVNTEEIDFFKEEIKDQITNSSWFIPFWKNDPTVNSMLNVLNKISRKFKDKSYYDRLKNIQFIIFPLKEHKLDDNLYIKMNSRGKELDEIEVFKGKFEKFLDLAPGLNTQVSFSLPENYPHKKYTDYFSFRFDTIWTEKIWNILGETDEGKDKPATSLDTAFKNYITFITEMLVYKDKKLMGDIGQKDEKGKNKNQFQINNLVNSFDKIEKIYASQENVDFLIKSLDKISTIYNIVKDKFSNNSFKIGKVALFDNETNLCETLLVRISKLTVNYKILLFFIIHQIVSEQDNNSICIDSIRVLRNLLFRVPRWDVKNLGLADSLSESDIQPILLYFLSRPQDQHIYEYINNSDEKTTTGFNSKNFESEKKKINLILNNSQEYKEIIFQMEDIKGIEGNIDYCISDVVDVENATKIDVLKPRLESLLAIRKIYDKNPTLLFNSLLANSNEHETFFLYCNWSDSMRKHKHSFIKNFKYIFTRTRLIAYSRADNLDNDEVWNNIILNYINQFVEQKNCNNIIKKSELANNKNSIIYYIINCDIFDKEYSKSTEYFMFVGSILNSFDIEKTDGKRPIKNNYSNPYLEYIAKKINKQGVKVEKNQDKHKSYLSICGLYYLNICGEDNGIDECSFYSKNENEPASSLLCETIKFNINSENCEYQGQDRIKVLIDKVNSYVDKC